MNKKLIIILGSVVGVLIALILILWLITVFKHKYFTYEQVETKIINASKQYYKKYPDLLPVNDGKYNLDYSALVTDELIKPLNELLKDGDNCTAKIYVVKNSDNYSYIPMLNCDNYQTRELYNQVLKDNPVVTSGNGLYLNSDGEYYFRGKIDNNYVILGTYEYSNKRVELPWRIISINKDKTIKLQATRHYEVKTVWDDRYNINRDQRTGYNDFELSVLKNFLENIEKDSLLFKSEEKALLVANNLCIGQRKKDDVTKDGSTECSKLTTNKMLFSTLLPYEYLRASLDDNCKSLNDESCVNYNYLADENSSSRWSITSDPIDTYHAYSYTGETFVDSTTSNEKYIYLVINLNEFSIYKSGNGTFENPYRLFKTNKK